MSISTKCPECGARLELNPSQRGKRVRCGGCDQLFVAEESDRDAEANERMPRRPDRAESGRSDRDFRRRSGRRGDDRDDDRDGDSRRGRRDSASQGSDLWVGVIVLGGLAALLLVIGVVAAVMMLRMEPSANSPGVAGGVAPGDFGPGGFGQDGFGQDVFGPGGGGGNDPDPINNAIARLRSDNVFAQSDAATALRKIAVNEARRAEVVAALKGVIDNRRPLIPRNEAVQALAVWGTRAEVPHLLGLLDDTDGRVQEEALTVLGKLKDARAAEAIAGRLSNFFQRSRASQALKDIGQPAEAAVRAQLTHTDGGVRAEACKILKVIGTAASHKALLEASQDEDRNVAQAAREALPAGERPPVYGPKETITVNIHIRNADAWPDIQARLKELLDSPKGFCKLKTISGEYYWVTVAPVSGTADAFARKIKFAKVVAVHNNQRLIYLDPDR